MPYKFALGYALMALVCGAKEVRVGYLPNLTHAQVLLGLANGDFQKSLGADVKITPFLFNAGPSIVEALFSGSIDLAYVGPNPAINAFIKSKGKAIKIISGSASGGVRLIVRPDAKIISPRDFAGKTLATPQLGNTQDVAARAWLGNQHLRIKNMGGVGDVTVLPVPNADQMNLFKRGDIQGAWSVEPWASRLVAEAGGVEFLDEKTLWPEGEFTTTVVVVAQKFLQENPDLVKKWLAAHAALTERIRKKSEPDQIVLNAELKRLTGKALPAAIVAEALKHIDFTLSPIESSLVKSSQTAFGLGLLGKIAPDLKGLVDLSWLPANKTVGNP